MELVIFITSKAVVINVQQEIKWWQCECTILKYGLKVKLKIKNRKHHVMWWCHPWCIQILNENFSNNQGYRPCRHRETLNLEEKWAKVVIMDYLAKRRVSQRSLIDVSNEESLWSQVETVALSLTACVPSLTRLARCGIRG